MTNSLLSPSTLPFGLPDYANLRDDDFREAIDRGMAEHLAELAVIASNTDPATVANVLEAWERSGSLLTRAMNAFWVAKSADTNDERDAIEEEFAPRLAQHEDAILLNPDLYRRLTELRRRADEGQVSLDDQEAHLLTEQIKDFERGGIALPENDQERLRELNTELATLATKYDQLLVAGRNAAGVLITDEAELDGLSADDRSAAREAAKQAGQDGWLITITNTTDQPALADLTNRAVRERVFRASTERGAKPGEHDTRGVLLAMTRLRDERARLLGFPHHAAYAAQDGCAGSTEAVNEILGRLGPAAFEIARARGQQLQAHLESIEPGARLEPWDWAYVERLLRAQEEVLDQGALRPYLELENVLTHGVFAAATALYGITFHRRDDLVGYTPDARVYEVREENGDVLGAVVIDPYTRPTKQGGAWMTSIVDQSHLLDDSPVVTNTCNFPPPAPGSPSLLSWDNVITLFHEFGHDLHGLLSDVRFPSCSGTAVPRDFVEFPSQVNEIWAFEPSLLADYAVHHETGEPMPPEWVEQLRDMAGKDTFGYAELLAACILDQAWHQTAAADLPADVEGVEAFERAALERAGVAHAPIPPRYRSTYFHHIFGGGYSAAYYSYLWSEIMDADTVAWFTEQGGLSRDAGEHFRRTLLAPGGSVEAMDSYRAFRGGDPDLSHLLKRIGAEQPPPAGQAPPAE
ncbi:M3 family metallopeptidase [Nocardioides piscis]|uniref:M3 family metallopeptidase n=1 Tax=Nocardioides piscis TaxID=2714938 RepID=A0A6G7YIW2_9ACTN|nr:M3 family metallopeptidase [Nocardioides piscis]QIK76676.1 M3 family metallopeptidase [Nocardioides piscis]